MPEGKLLTKGLAERIGERDKGRIIFPDRSFEGDLPSHTRVLEKLKSYLDEHAAWPIHAIGHRVVHGGNEFVEPVRINEKVKQKIRSLFNLAPLHNPPNLAGIEASEQYFPGIPQVAVFDTAFHQTIPEFEHRYAIPEKFYRDGIRQYGFHGISHSYIAKQVMKKSRAAVKVVSLHLGNGASATAILNGKSVAHSMGFGPLSGLIMGTRSGDIDPSVLLYWMQQLAMTAYEISRILNKESGLRGLTGYNDMRELERLYEKREARALLAIRMYVNRIKKYIGGYAALMNGLDALVFTAGIGEHSSLIRKKTCEDLDYLGLSLDAEKNLNPQLHDGLVHAEDSRVKIYVIPTNEELEIAAQTYQVLNPHSS